MKHLAQINIEFMKIARQWDEVPYDLQVAYLSRHPQSNRKVTARPPKGIHTRAPLRQDLVPSPDIRPNVRKDYVPSRSQSHDTLEKLRNTLGIESFQIPAQKNYLTFREGSHNKFHYFTIFKDNKSGEWIAANAYGAIGYPNTTKVAVIERSPSQAQAEFAYEEKLRKKLKKGYKETSL